MPVGTIKTPKLHPVTGIKIATVKAGIRYVGRKDLVLFAIEDSATVSAVFTKNHFCAAPVQICREHLQTTSPRYLIINTGNANAGTGIEGMEAARQVCKTLATKAKVPAASILPFSTGVTVEKLPVDRIVAGLDGLLEKLDVNGWNDAAEGIMTTDTVPKGATVKFSIDGEEVTITGITKGSGMIKPNMATMLSFIGTDVAVAKEELDLMLLTACDKSFNRITVDGDTSTNDSCVLMASSRGVKLDTDKKREKFLEQLIKLQQTLAQNMVQDAEGATKFITIKVSGGASSGECLNAAYIIAHSPLVKTAFFASDPNWGRIMVALGNCKIKEFDVSKVNIWLGEVKVLENGAMAQSYTEESGSKVMRKEQIIVRIDLGRGSYKESVWTSDLSHDYITINADYRT